MALIQQHSCDKCRCIITEENGYINLHMKSGDKTNPSVLINCEDVCKRCLAKILNLPIEVRTEYVYESSETHGGATGPLPPPELENNSGTSRVSRCVSVAASLAGHS